MTDFLLELLSEEIPARMQAKARADLERLFAAQMADAGLKTSAITVYSTPRRLALIAKDLPAQTAAVSDEAKGPPEAAPDQAVDGFCRKNSVTRDQARSEGPSGRCGGNQQARPRNRGRAGGRHSGDYQGLPMAQIHALGRGQPEHRKPALGAAAERDCRDTGR